MSDEIVRRIAVYHGHVQGVGFRATVVSEARGLSINGFVRNEADGSVLLDIEGPRSDVAELLSRISRTMRRYINDSQIEDRRLPQSRTGGLKIAY